MRDRRARGLPGAPSEFAPGADRAEQLFEPGYKIAQIASL